jgi:hypothetical protein
MDLYQVWFCGGEVGGERDGGVHTEAHEAADSHEPKTKLIPSKKNPKNTAHCETHEAADSHEPQNALRRAPHQAHFLQKFFLFIFQFYQAHFLKSVPVVYLTPNPSKVYLSCA